MRRVLGILIGVATVCVLVGRPLPATEILVDDPGGAAAAVGAPVSVPVDLSALPSENGRAKCLQLVEIGEGTGGTHVPAQFELDGDNPSRGTLWWLMPPGAKGRRRFRLEAVKDAPERVLAAKYAKDRQYVDVTDGSLPVLRYNHGTVPPPAEIVDHFEKRDQPLYYARGDYIHPLYGPDGEQLTDDYSVDHPHHRGVFWSWPVLRWKGEVRDIWAVRVLPDQPGGAWARPVAMHCVSAGPVLAKIDAENVWKWGDKDPIVREDVSIRAFRSQEGRRFVDIEVRLTALEDDVLIGGRPKGTYGGFTFRTFPKFEGRNIAMHVDPPEATPRRAWFHLTGKVPGAKGPLGVALMEHVSNPAYPNRPDPEGPDRIPGKYPRWRSVTPAFPGDREVALSKETPLVLKHRLWIHPGMVGDDVLKDVWDSYAEPPKARLVD